MSERKNPARDRRRAKARRQEHDLPPPNMEGVWQLPEDAKKLESLGLTFKGFDTVQANSKSQDPETVASGQTKTTEEATMPSEKKTVKIWDLNPSNFPTPKPPAPPKPHLASTAETPAKQGAPVAKPTTSSGARATLEALRGSVQAFHDRIEQKLTFAEYMELLTEELLPQLETAKATGDKTLVAVAEGNILRARKANREVDEELKRREKKEQQVSFETVLAPMRARVTHTIHEAQDALKSDQTIHPIIPPVVLPVGTVVPGPAAQRGNVKTDTGYSYNTVSLTTPGVVLLELSGEMKLGDNGGEFLEILAHVISQTPNVCFDQHTGWKDGPKGVFDFRCWPIRDSEGKILRLTFIRKEESRSYDRFDAVKVILTSNFQLEWEDIVKVRDERRRLDTQRAYAEMLKREKDEAALGGPGPIGSIIERLPGKVVLSSTYMGGVKGQPCERFAEVVLAREPDEEYHTITVWANSPDVRGIKFHALCHGSTAIPFILKEKEPVELTYDQEGNPVLDEETKLPVGTGTIFCRIPDKYKGTREWLALVQEANEIGPLTRQCVLNKMLELHQKGTPYVRPEPAPDSQDSEEVTAEPAEEAVPE